MAPLLKEKTEATSTAPEAASPLPGRTATDHLSADAVSLEVPVNIHGSRVTDAVRGAAPNTEPFEEQTTTMIVFPQGGVLRMSTPVTTGQMLVLTNLKSRQDAICRVVKVRSYANAAGYVEVEFTHAQAGYWGVYFSSDASELSKKAPGALSLDAAELNADQKPAGSLAQPAAPVLTQPKDQAGSSPSSQRQTAPSGLGISANRNESSFISIGSQEEVQISASSTTFKSGSRIASEAQRPATPSKNQPTPIQQARATSEPRETQSLANSLSSTETTIVDREKPAAMPAQSSGETFGEVFGGSSQQAALRDPQSSGLEPGLSAASPAGSQNWKLIAGGAALGIVLAGGAFFLMRPSANGSSVPKTVPAPAAEVQPVVTQPAAPSPAQSTPVRSTSTSAPQTPPVAPKNNLLAEAKRTESAAAPTVKTPQPEEAPAAEPARATPAAKHNVPDVTSDLFGSLNAHPVAGRADEKSQTDAAPELSAPAQLNAVNSSPIIPAQTAVPLPVPTQSVPGSPLQAGGAVPEPRLLSSTLPVYPAAAQQTRTEGAVVVRALVNERGQVTDAQAVSGPTLLRQSAVEAVKHWKYEPSHVNGKPIAVQTLVTIHFRL